MKTTGHSYLLHRSHLVLTSTNEIGNESDYLIIGGETSRLSWQVVFLRKHSWKALSSPNGAVVGCKPCSYLFWKMRHLQEP